MRTTIRLITILLGTTTLYLSSGCQKEILHDASLFEAEMKKPENSIGNFAFKKTIFSNREVSYSSSNPTTNTLLGIFLQDSILLQTIVSTENSELAENYLTSLTNDISDYFLQTENIDVRAEFSNDRNSIILLGLFISLRPTILAPGERNSKSNVLVTGRAPTEPSIDCFITAVSSLIGISEGQAIWNSIKAGASTQTVIGALKLIARRVASAITVAFMIYEVGECLDWW